jgi:hypothetical protein
MVFRRKLLSKRLNIKILSFRFYGLQGPENKKEVLEMLWESK